MTWRMGSDDFGIIMSDDFDKDFGSDEGWLRRVMSGNIGRVMNDDFRRNDERWLWKSDE